MEAAKSNGENRFSAIAMGSQQSGSFVKGSMRGPSLKHSVPQGLENRDVGSVEHEVLSASIPRLGLRALGALSTTSKSMRNMAQPELPQAAGRMAHDICTSQYPMEDLVMLRNMPLRLQLSADQMASTLHGAVNASKSIPADKQVSLMSVVIDASKTLDQPEQRALLLNAVASTVPQMDRSNANAVAANLFQAQRSLSPEQQSTLARAIQGPDNGTRRGFGYSGLF